MRGRQPLFRTGAAGFRLVPWLLAFSLVLSAFFTTERASAAAPAVRLAIPTYFRTTADWNAVLASGDDIGLALINPNSGPGTTVDPTYAGVTTRLNAARIRAVGYISTQYGRRSITSVTAEMARYRTLYGITSYFLDEAPNVCTETVGASTFDHVDYYRQAHSAAHSASATSVVVINPGTDVPECFAPVADVIVNFEASASTYATWSPSPWVQNYSPSKFWHLIHSVDANQIPSIVSTAASRHAALVYATIDVLPNPWDTLGDARSFNELRLAAAATNRQAVVGGPAAAPSITLRSAAGGASGANGMAGQQPARRVADAAA